MDTCRCAGISRGAPIYRGIGKLLLIVAAVLVWSCLAAAPAQAQATVPPDTACKLCHVDNEGEITLPSGETIQLGIDLAPLSESVHGAQLPSQSTAWTAMRAAIATATRTSPIRP